VRAGFGSEFVHQEADRAAMHAVDRHMAVEKAVQRLEHEAVAAEGHDDVGLFGRCRLVAALQLVQRRLSRSVSVATTATVLVSSLSCAAGPSIAASGALPPVTLIWRARPGADGGGR